METMGKKVKTCAYVFGLALVALLVSNFSSVNKQTLSKSVSCPVPEYILGVKAAPPESAEETTRNTTSTDTSIVGNLNASTEEAESIDDDEIFAADVNCSAVEPFNEISSFGNSFENENVVVFKPRPIPEGPFTKIGFVKVGFVFGIRIIGSKAIPDDDFERTVKIVAKYIDNDEDGKPDYPEAVREIRKYNVVVGYLNDSSESETLWVSKFRDSKHEDFRKVFFCHIHFFEQWLVDANKDFHVVSSADQCEAAEKQSFDWPLWYFLFTIAYYGYLESFSDEQNNIIKEAMKIAKDGEKFSGNYPDDEEMERADFFAWALLTKLNALQCHCNAEVIRDVWKLCTAENDLQKLGPKFSDFLDNLRNMPKVVPDGNYNSPAVV